MSSPSRDYEAPKKATRKAPEPPPVVLSPRQAAEQDVTLAVHGWNGDVAQAEAHGRADGRPRLSLWAEGSPAAKVREVIMGAIEKVKNWIRPDRERQAEVDRQRAEAAQRQQAQEAARAAAQAEAQRLAQEAAQAEARAKAAQAEAEAKAKASEEAGGAGAVALVATLEAKAETTEPNSRRAQEPAKVALAEARSEVLRQEAAKPIAFKHERIAGVAPAPEGSIDRVQTGRGAWVVGVGGRWTAADVSDATKRAKLVQALAGAAPAVGPKGGKPVQHVAHLVASWPCDAEGRPIEEPTDEACVRAGRWALLGQGIDPRDHDHVIVLHRGEPKRKPNGEVKRGECAIHVIASRITNGSRPGVRPGLIHDLEGEVVAAALTSMRLQSAGELPIEELRTTAKGSKVHDEAIESIKNGNFKAQLRDKSGKSRWNVPLTGEVFEARLAEEAPPDVGESAGLLIVPKTKSRDGGILSYVFRGH